MPLTVPEVAVLLPVTLLFVMVTVAVAALMLSSIHVTTPVAAVSAEFCTRLLVMLTLATCEPAFW